jgi:hypothetical protein
MAPESWANGASPTPEPAFAALETEKEQKQFLHRICFLVNFPGIARYSAPSSNLRLRAAGTWWVRSSLKGPGEMRWYHERANWPIVLSGDAEDILFKEFGLWIPPG